MEIFLDCLPCMMKQALEASRMTTQNVELQEKIMDESIKIVAEHKQYKCSPDLGRAIHQIVKKYTDCPDPYKNTKEKDIAAAKKVYPFLKSFLNNKGNSLYWALKIAATGNIIDSAIYNNLNIEDCIDIELEKEFKICDIEIFEDKLRTAGSLLIIGDNAGETVFDKVLAEHLPQLEITYAVRNAPILNDATVNEAYDSGLGDCTRIISTGCNAPGTILEECSTEFIHILKSADIVISKGQGNFESLSDENLDIFFLLKAKCLMVSQELGVDLNSFVLKYNKNENRS